MCTCFLSHAHFYFLVYFRKLHSVASECTALRALGVACMGGGLEAGKAEDTDEPEKAGELLAQALQCFEV